MLLRGARQVGKSTAVQHLGESFENFVQINFEKQPSYKMLFDGDIEVKRIVPQMAAIYGTPIVSGKTLLFLDEIQACPKAITALRYFKEDMPNLHVVAAGSLLEFVLGELSDFGVGRIHSMFMYPMTFDEFLDASGEHLLLEARNSANASHPLPEPLYQKIVSLFRTFLLVGGMPEAVAKWVETHDYLSCQEVQDDIIVSYEDDFSKYKKKVDPELLKQTLISAANQVTEKFVCSKVSGNYTTREVKNALSLLSQAGILIPVTHTDSNGLPLGSEKDVSYQKIIILDTGLMLRLLNMTIGGIAELTSHILTNSVADLVNKGPMGEMVAGLELLHYRTPNLRYELFYWVRQAKNSTAKVDYISSNKSIVLPIEIKAGIQGGMKSLWMFMREKKLSLAVRCSLENFGEYDYIDKDENGTVRHVVICPLFSVSQMERLIGQEKSLKTSKHNRDDKE